MLRPLPMGEARAFPVVTALAAAPAAAAPPAVVSDHEMADHAMPDHPHVDLQPVLRYIGTSRAKTRVRLGCHA